MREKELTPHQSKKQKQQVWQVLFWSYIPSRCLIFNSGEIIITWIRTLRKCAIVFSPAKPSALSVANCCCPYAYWNIASIAAESCLLAFVLSSDGKIKGVKSVCTRLYYKLINNIVSIDSNNIITLLLLLLLLLLLYLCSVSVCIVCHHVCRAKDGEGLCIGSDHVGHCSSCHAWKDACCLYSYWIIGIRTWSTFVQNGLQDLFRIFFHIKVPCHVKHTMRMDPRIGSHLVPIPFKTNGAFGNELATRTALGSGSCGQTRIGKAQFFEKNEPPCVACISWSPSSKDSLTSSNFTFSLSTLRTSTSSFWAACEIGTMFSSSFGVSGRPSELLVSACRFSSSKSELSQALAFFLSLVHAPNAFGCFRFCDFCGRDLADNPNGIGTGGFRAPVPFCGVVLTKKSELSSSAATNKREASSNEWLQSQCSTAISVNCADVDLKNSENKWCVVEIFGCPSSFFSNNTLSSFTFARIAVCKRGLLRITPRKKDVVLGNSEDFKISNEPVMIFFSSRCFCKHRTKAEVSFHSEVAYCLHIVGRHGSKMFPSKSWVMLSVFGTRSL